jgi:uncharacterized membrane protein (DUF485 family)
MPAWRFAPGDTISIGWLIALIVMIITLVLAFTTGIPREAALLIVAVCALRL